MTETPMVDRKISKQRVATIVVISMLVIGLVVSLLDLNEVKKLIGETNWKMVPWVLLFTAISYLCISFGFALVVQLFNSKIELRKIASIGFISTVLNHLLSSGGAAGLSVRFLLLQDKTTTINTILGASLFHSYFTSLGMLALLLLGLGYILANHSLSMGFATSILIAVILLVGLFFLSSGIVFNSKLRNHILRIAVKFVKTAFHHNFEEKAVEFSTTISMGVKNASQQKRKFFLILVFIITDWAASIIALRFCFSAFGSSPSIGVLVSGFVIGITAGVLSMIPGGFGIQEGSMSGIYVLFGVPLTQAVLAAILFRLIYYFVPLLVSIAFYWLLLHQMRKEAIIND